MKYREMSLEERKGKWCCGCQTEESVEFITEEAQTVRFGGFGFEIPENSCFCKDCVSVLESGEQETNH